MGGLLLLLATVWVVWWVASGRGGVVLDRVTRVRSIDDQVASDLPRVFDEAARELKRDRL